MLSSNTWARRACFARTALGLLALVLGACGADRDRFDGEVPAISAAQIAEYARTLSSDAFEGRGSGQAGGRMAADYIADAFGRLGLEAPSGSYLQPVPIIGYAPLRESVSLSAGGPGGQLTPTYLDDFVLTPGDAEAQAISAEGELVFVGYGIRAPEAGWDDYAGIDVAGKYVLVLINDPPAPDSEPQLFGGEAMTYYGRWTYKYEEAARQGALGALIVHEAVPASYPWSVVRSGWGGEQFALPRDSSGAAPLDIAGWVSVDTARRLLRLGRQDFSDLKARAAVRGFTAVRTGVTVRGSVSSRVRRVDTQNVAGLLRGSERPDEYVLVTAHYDHLGVGEPVDGDSIYNGAYDNASGVGLMMAMAEAMASMADPPERSVLFLATGAEEQGLLGAQWYVRSPLLPLDHAVAVVNFDGANLWGTTTDVVVGGADRSELGDFVRPRSTQMGLTLSPDPEPQAGHFFRSDHFPFAKAGVPALYVDHGRSYLGRPAGWGMEVQRAYTANDYHAPSDEWSDDFVLDGAVQEATLGMLTILDLTADDGWPNWYEGEEFRAARDSMMAGR